jgi:Mn-dependent DtxR family transcriptional regulator
MIQLEAEEYMNETKAGSDLTKMEELMLTDASYKPFIALPHLVRDLDDFPEDRELDGLLSSNSSVMFQNYDRVNLARYISYMESMLESESEYLRSSGGAVIYMAQKTSREDYLRAIYHLLEEEEADEVKSVDLADFLEISKPSVAEMLDNLAEEGFVDKEKYSGVALTKKGAKEAKRITFKHRIIEVFLLRFLKIDKKDLHKEAHKLEHAFSDEVIKKLSAALNNPKKCPHGSLIPK